MGQGKMSMNYHNTRFSQNVKRDRLWKALWRFYFRDRIKTEDTVLDLGCGYGSFINNIKAKRRIALDEWPDYPKYIEPGIETVVAKTTDLSSLQDSSIDFAFASNVFEHMSQHDLSMTLASLKKKLAKNGRLTILQPNYRYCSSEYFDDYTHISIWSHISLADFLSAHGYEVTEIHPRFLPLTIKSRLPVHPYLIGLYLKLPFKPMGKQMLLVARPK